MKKKKQASPNTTHDSHPSREQLESDLISTLKAFDTSLRERDLSRKTRQAFDQLIADADAGSKESADRVLRLALDCTAWLDKRVTANDPVILELAKFFPYWPTLFYPHQKTVSLPSTLATGYEALDVVKLAHQTSRPREVAWRLLRVVDLLFKAMEAKSYADKLETILGEIGSLDVLGHEISVSFEKKLQSGLDDWKIDAKCCRESLIQATKGLEQFLGVEDGLHDTETFDSDMEKLFPLPPKEHPDAVKLWWKVAKKLFLTVTNNHPERCEILAKVAKSKADAYIKEFPKKHEGAQSVQKAGIIGEVGKAFKNIFRTPTAETGESLAPEEALERVKE